MIFQAAAILACAAAGVLGLWQAAQAAGGPSFLLYLLPGILAVALAPLIAYRVYALWGGSYTLERDGIRLRWGLRIEEIPMDQILWVRSASEVHIPLPWLRWPGAVLGSRRLSDGTPIEFLAANTGDLVLIATPQRIYAISPADPGKFLHAFGRLTELGSLTPIQAQSVYPTFLLSNFWADSTARILLIGGLALSLTLLIWVGLSIPSRTQVALRLSPDGAALEFAPAVRLMLLPVLNGGFFLIDLFLGLFFYRRKVSQVSAINSEPGLAYILWGSSVLTGLFFLAAVFFILRAP